LELMGGTPSLQLDESAQEEFEPPLVQLVSPNNVRAALRIKIKTISCCFMRS